MLAHSRAKSMKFLIGKKQHMTQVFGEDGRVYPATIVKVGPVVVTQIKQGEKEGYQAVQVGFGSRKESNITKSLKGHSKGHGNFSGFREFRMDGGEVTVKPGDSIDVSVFNPGDEVTIISTSKGKGFQGAVKRHGFGGGRRSHGQKHSEREVGSIGGGGRAGGRVAKGMRMAGRMGGDRVTLHHVKVLQINKEGNELLLHGSVPGRPGTIIEISSK